MKRITWNSVIISEFARDALLTDEEVYIVKSMAKGASRVAMSLHIGASLSTVDRMIRRIWEKYDQAALYNPLLPPQIHR